MLTKALRAVIIGAPGSGKGTISERIAKYFGVTHVSSGDLLRFNAVQHTGFPRTRNQAEILHNIASINVAVNLIVPTEVIISRIAGRWVHVPSGRGKDDETGEPLMQRADDMPEAVQNRLDVYNATIQPIIEFYAAAGVLKDFKGTESNKIWPEVYQYLATLVKPKLPFP
ncbi:hypothetical protein B566_EDAN007625 [Ephemera danica]|nr:hypothetical protein B566_EDAN007625 [Ephemera danica]